MRTSVLEKLQSVARGGILAAGLITFAGVPAIAMGRGGQGGTQHMKGITGYGTGTGSNSCDGSSCTESASGTFRGTGIGNGSFSVTLKYSNSNPIDNGSGGSCFGASGTITLTVANGDTIALADAGLLCEVGSGSTPTTFNGAYIAQNGTGRFANANGTGTAALATDSSGNVYLNLAGAMGGMGHMGGGGMGGGGGGMM